MSRKLGDSVGVITGALSGIGLAPAHAFAIPVNLSARQLQHPYLVEEVAKTLSETGFDPRALVLEYTKAWSWTARRTP